MPSKLRAQARSLRLTRRSLQVTAQTVLLGFITTGAIGALAFQVALLFHHKGLKGAGVAAAFAVVIVYCYCTWALWPGASG